MSIELVSIHIPKTAGTSFRRALEHIYGQDAIFHDNGEYTGVGLTAMPIELHHRVIHGHVWAGRYRKLLPDVRCVTWLRHPVDWLVSLYAFLESLEPNNNPAWKVLKEEQPNLLDFAASQSVHIQSQNKFLTQVPLDAFFFVGLQEHFAEDLQAFVAMMGWPPIDMPRENVNPFTQDFRSQVWSDRTMVEGICDRLEADMKLYEEAVQRRRRRLEGGPVAA